MSAADRVAKIALGEVGVREMKGNTGLPFERYALPGEQPLAWCARFVRYCWEGAGLALPGNRYENAAVRNMQKAFKGAGMFVHFPVVGAVVFYTTRKGSDVGVGHHCGVVVAVDGDKITTVEGNFGDKVATRTYVLPNKTVAGFGLPPEEP